MPVSPAKVFFTNPYFYSLFSIEIQKYILDANFFKNEPWLKESIDRVERNETPWSPLVKFNEFLETKTIAEALKAEHKIVLY